MSSPLSDENDTAGGRNRTATTLTMFLWAGSAGIGFGLGCLIAAWISATDSHTGVGMAGFARWVLAILVAAVIAALGLVLVVFRRTRRLGGAMLAAGGGMLVPLTMTM